MTIEEPVDDLTYISESSNSSLTSKIKKSRVSKNKKIDAELMHIFWEAPMEAFFGQDVIASVTHRSVKTLECDRWKGNNIPYRKCSGRVLYRKKDVVEWIESHVLKRERE